MKKMIVLFLLFVSVVGKTVLANEPLKITRKAQETFDNRFPNASLAKWQQLKNLDIYQVTFIYNNNSILSFIDMDGELLGFARNVMNEKLPYLVNEVLTRKFQDYSMISAAELIKDDLASYLFTLENDKFQVYARIWNNGSVSVIKKIRKV